MDHPQTAPGGWTLEYIVYPGSPGEIAVGVLNNGERQMMGLRWCEAQRPQAPWQTGQEDWFVLPFRFAAAITRTLLQLKATGFTGFDEDGLQQLIEWMSEDDAIDYALDY